MNTKQMFDKYDLCTGDQFPYDHVQTNGLAMTDRRGKTDAFDWGEIERLRVSAVLDSRTAIARGIAERVRVQEGRNACILGKVRVLRLESGNGATFIGDVLRCQISHVSTLVSAGSIKFVEIEDTKLDERQQKVTRSRAPLCSHLVHFGNIGTLSVGKCSQVIVFGDVEQLSYTWGSQIFVFGAVKRHDFKADWSHDRNLERYVDLKILPPCRYDRIGAVTVVELTSGDYLWQDIEKPGLYTFEVNLLRPGIYPVRLHVYAHKYNLELALALIGCPRETRLSACQLVALIQEIARVMYRFGQGDRAIEVVSECLAILEKHQPSSKQDPAVLAQLCTMLAQWYPEFNCHSLGLTFDRRAACYPTEQLTATAYEEIPSHLRA